MSEVSQSEMDKMKFFQTLCKSCQRIVAWKIARGKTVHDYNLCPDCAKICREEKAKREGGKVD